MIGGLGMQELLVILAIVMLLFGGKRLPELGKGLGKAIRGFKHAEDETMKELEKASAEAQRVKTAKPEAAEMKDEPVADKGGPSTPPEGPGQEEEAAEKVS